MRLPGVWDCCQHGATSCLQRWHLTWHAVATAEVFLTQAPGPQKSFCLCVTPGPGEGLEKLGCQHKGSRGKLLKAFLESWKQEMFNQSLREKKQNKAKQKKNKLKKKERKRRPSISEQPGCLWNPCSVYYDAEFQLAALLKTAGTHYLCINTEPAFILKLTRCWELSLMLSCCCQLHNPHQQPRGKITSLCHTSYFRRKAS